MKEAHNHEHGVKVSKVDRLKPTQVRLHIEMPGNVVLDHEESMVRRYANQAKLPGFRPGKAPAKMVKEKFKDEIQRDLLSHLVESALGEALEQTKFMPVNRPKIQLKEFSSDGTKPFQFEAEFEVQPEIEVRNYKGVPVKPIETTASEEEINKTFDNLRERLATLEPSLETKAARGLFGIVELGVSVDGELKKESSKSYTIEIDGGQVLPELDKGLIGMAVGEMKTIRSKFPADYPDKKLAGKEASYEAKLLELKKKVMPELDDAFANQIKEGATLKTLSDEIKQSIESGKKEDGERNRRREVLDYLVKQNKFEVPVSMIEHQMSNLWNWMQEDFKRRGMTPPATLKDEDQASLRARAEEMVKGSLLLREISSKEKIEIDEQKLEEKISAISQQLNRNVEDTRKFLVGKGMMDQLRDEILTDQVYDFLIKNSEPAKK